MKKIRIWMLLYTIIFAYLSYGYIQDDINLKYHILYIIWGTGVYIGVTIGNVMYSIRYVNHLITKIWKVFFFLFVLDFLAGIPIDLFFSDAGQRPAISIVWTVVFGLVVFFPSFRSIYILGNNPELVTHFPKKDDSKNTIDDKNKLSKGVKIIGILNIFNCVMQIQALFQPFIYLTCWTSFSLYVHYCMIISIFLGLIFSVFILRREEWARRYFVILSMAGIFFILLFIPLQGKGHFFPTEKYVEQHKAQLTVQQINDFEQWKNVRDELFRKRHITKENFAKAVENGPKINFIGNIIILLWYLLLIFYFTRPKVKEQFK